MAHQADTDWVRAHFIGGHPALDLANAVFDRRVPARDNELLKSPRDAGNWMRAAGLADGVQAEAVAGIADAGFMDGVREIREASFAIFDALAAGAPPAVDSIALLFERAAIGLAAARVEPDAMRPRLGAGQWRDADAVLALLAMLAVEAFFTVPRERLHACPRCGWLFLDTSRGGKRRWCSMRTCGNREKASRHQGHGG